MFLKRFSLAAVICFALLSLFAPRFGPVRIVEVTTLLLFQPWERLLSFRLLSGEGDDPDSFKKDPWDRSSSSRLWWRAVFETVRLGSDVVLLGGRVIPPSGRNATRIKVDMGSDPPVRRDDPVICGTALVGFVRAVEDDGLVEVSLLGDSDSRSVAAEVGDVVAGEKIYFPIGGGCDDQGNLPIKFPSTRFGLISGSDVSTSSEHKIAYTETPVPVGLDLGKVNVAEPGRSVRKARAVVIPILRVTDLRRVAILLPSDRPGVAECAPVPELKLYTIPIEVLIPPGLLREWSFMRLCTGLESGLEEGDFIVSGDYLAGRIAATGFLSARADILLLPGKIIGVARLTLSGAEGIRLRVLDRAGCVCSVEADKTLSNLERGCPLYFPDEPCAGTEFYPVCHVLDPGDGVSFTVRCADPAGDDSSFCLGFRK